MTGFSFLLNTYSLARHHFLGTLHVIVRQCQCFMIIPKVIFCLRSPNSVPMTALEGLKERNENSIVLNLCSLQLALNQAFRFWEGWDFQLQASGRGLEINYKMYDFTQMFICLNVQIFVVNFFWFFYKSLRGFEIASTAEAR